MLQDRRSRLADDRFSVKASLVPDGEASAPRVGAELAVARERLGRTLPEMSHLLRIRRPYLEALEQGRINALPGRAYALAFLRTYAAALGLDADEAVRRFKAEAAEVCDRTELDFPAPLPERGLPTGALLLLGLVLAVGAYAGWYRLSGEGRLPAETVMPVPARLARLSAPAPTAVPTSGTPARPGATGSTSAPAGTTGASETGSGDVATGSVSSPGGPGGTMAQATADNGSGGATVSSAPQMAAGDMQGIPAGAGSSGAGSSGAGAAGSGSGDGSPVATGVADAGVTHAGAARAGQALAALPAPEVAPGSAAAATPTPAQSAALLGSGGPDASGLLVLATADAWVQVRSSAGAVVFSHLLHAGQSWTVPSGRDLVMTTGNAGGTELVRNGVASAPLGAPGVVLRNVPLAPAAGGPAASAPMTSAPMTSAPMTSAPMTSGPMTSGPAAPPPGTATEAR